MSRTPLHAEVKELLLRAVRLEDDVEPWVLADDQPIFESPDLDLDSVDGLEIVAALEQRYGVHFDNNHLARAILRSVDSIVEFVEATRTR